MEKFPLNLPELIKNRDVDGAVKVLRRYYGSCYPVGDPAGQETFTGAWFDEFDPSENRDSHPNEFTADDLVSVALLNTPIGNTAAKSLLLDDDLRADISALLGETSGADYIWEFDGPVDSSWSLWRLETLLTSRRVRGIGPTRASKLIARKRPHLYPIYDKVVRDLIWSDGMPDGSSFLGTVHQVFQDTGLQKFLGDAREGAQIPERVPLLRIFDVLAWMQGKGPKQAYPSVS